MIDILGVGSLLIIVLIQRFVLSNNRYTWLGAILPILFLLGTIYLVSQSSQGFTVSNILVIFFGTTMLLGFWAAGHESYKKKISAEYETTKAKDNQN